ncbi:hypothetical protein [Alkaliphilus transvaalensis]|uniref:hypothetical protein n=1 Tax=Alkaliphilus transvaalensis TaxID=114628 RepID=UPI00047A6380|nr:hypothetical protein [Alkaliphilus transvaalensis]
MEHVLKHQIEEMERTLNCIPSVLYTKIEAIELQDADGSFDIEEINVVSTTERNPKQISRDVQAIFNAKFKLDIDHKKISIAQIFYQESNSIKHRDRRLNIQGIDYSITGNQIRTEVKLKWDDHLFTATDIGPNTPTNTYRVIANATLGAIHQFIDQDHFFAVEDIQKINIGKKEVIVVCISVVASEYEEVHIGNAIVKGDLRESIVRATLDALNRRLAKIC